MEIVPSSTDEDPPPVFVCDKDAAGPVVRIATGDGPPFFVFPSADAPPGVLVVAADAAPGFAIVAGDAEARCGTDAAPTLRGIADAKLAFFDGVPDDTQDDFGPAVDLAIALSAVSEAARGLPATIADVATPLLSANTDLAPGFSAAAAAIASDVFVTGTDDAAAVGSVAETSSVCLGRVADDAAEAFAEDGDSASAPFAASDPPPAFFGAIKDDAPSFLAAGAAELASDFPVPAPAEATTLGGGTDDEPDAFVAATDFAPTLFAVADAAPTLSAAGAVFELVSVDEGGTRALSPYQETTEKHLRRLRE